MTAARVSVTLQALAFCLIHQFIHFNLSMRTRVKICGITRPQDALMAASAGCDAIGLVFYADSLRNVSVEQAVEIITSLPAFVAPVGLFVNAETDRIDAVLSKVRLSFLQFHGDETPEQCRQFGMPYIKAIRVRPGANLLQYAAAYGDASALLFDTYTEGVAGGTGQAFDWKLIPADLPQPVILAGGLNAGNVGMAIRQIRPFAVDVSGGVEAAKGIKDADKLAAFMRGVYDANV